MTPVILTPHLCPHGVQYADDYMGCLPCANEQLRDRRREAVGLDSMLQLMAEALYMLSSHITAQKLNPTSIQVRALDQALQRLNGRR